MNVMHSLAYRAPATIDRRKFLGAAATVAALLPASRLWAEAAATSAIPSEISAVTLDGKPAVLAGADLKELRASLKGALLLAQDTGYDQARRVWNGSIDRHPALIVRCSNREDIVRAVQFASSHSLLTAVKGGGHSLSGQSTCEGGVMIDLSALRGIEVYRAKRMARAESGVLLAQLDAACQAEGLVTTLGTAADTGIAGLTLGGGLGRLMRKFGLSCDNVVAFDLVTADGKMRRANATENPDLYWALRGGGGNYGIVTAFEYRLHPLAHPVLAGGRTYSFDQARSVIAGIAELAAGAPDEVYLDCGVFNESGQGALPKGSYVYFEYVFCGEPKDGEHFLATLDKLGKALNDTIKAKPYVVAQNGPTGAAPQALPAGLGVYVRSGFVQTISGKFIDEMIHAFEQGPPWLDGIGIGPMGGQVARVKPDATAYWNRDAAFDLLMGAAWVDHAEDEHNIAAMRDLWKVFEPYTRGYYVNTEPSAAEARVKATYGDNYARMVQIKDKYDPKNLFRLNANIRPSVHT